MWSQVGREAKQRVVRHTESKVWHKQVCSITVKHWCEITKQLCSLLSVPDWLRFTPTSASRRQIERCDDEQFDPTKGANSYSIYIWFYENAVTTLYNTKRCTTLVNQQWIFLDWNVFSVSITAQMTSDEAILYDSSHDFKWPDYQLSSCKDNDEHTSFEKKRCILWSSKMMGVLLIAKTPEQTIFWKQGHDR